MTWLLKKFMLLSLEHLMGQPAHTSARLASKSAAYKLARVHQKPSMHSIARV
jgi:hypothetical protein